jgi:hypothetical protein
VVPGPPAVAGDPPLEAPFEASLEARLRRVLGRGGSSSRMIRWISASPAPRSRAGSNGGVPLTSSYSSTPSEYTSVRVSTSRPLIAARSGLM